MCFKVILYFLFISILSEVKVRFGYEKKIYVLNKDFIIRIRIIILVFDFKNWYKVILDL